MSQVATPGGQPKEIRTTTANYALKVWQTAAHVTDIASHAYAIAKHLGHAYGAGRARVTGRVVGRNADCIVVPVRDLATEHVVAIQAINAEGKKQTFGSVRGHALPLGNTLDTGLTRHIVEGWATAAWLLKHHHGNACVFCAFGQANMEHAAEKVASLYGGRIIIGGEA